MAEPTYEDVISALRAADAAGDSEGAARLAQMAASLKAPKDDPNDPNSPNHSKALEAYGTVMRPLIKGLSVPMNTLFDGLAATGNVTSMLLGSDKRFPLMSQLQDADLDAREYKGQKVYPRSDNPLVKAGQDAVEGTFGALATGPAVASRELVNTVPKVVATAAGSVAAPPVAEKVSKVTGYDALGQLAGMTAGAVVGGAAGKGTAAATREPYLSLKEIQGQTSKAYQTVDNSGLTVRRSSLNNMMSQIQQDLADARFDPSIPSQAEVAARVNTLNRLVSDPNHPVTLSRLDDFRKWASDLRSNPDANVRRLGSTIISTIDNHISGMDARDFYTGGNTAPADAIKALQQARMLTRNRARAEVLDDILDSSEIRGLGDNASEGKILQQKMISLAADKKKMAAFSPEEQKIIEAVVRGGPADKLLAVLARFNPERGSLGTLTAIGGGAAAAQGQGVGKLGMALGGGGFLADHALTAKRVAAARVARDAIANGRPMESQGYMPNGLFGGYVTSQDAADMERLFGR